MNDIFGLKRERRIREAGVRQVFTPHVPIQSLDLFFGRIDEVRYLVEQLNTPGQHALLFGDRGVGKSSLANVTSELLLQHVAGGKFVRKRCDSRDNFVTIVAEPLKAAGIDIYVGGVERTKAEGGKAGLDIGFASAGVDTTTTTVELREGYSSRAESPSWVAEQICSVQGLFLIDEVDALRDPADKQRLAELVKHLSDSKSPLKLLLVGIADTAQDLTAGHPSVQRCLRETRLSRMSDTELADIIVGGQRKLGIEFSGETLRKIVAVSSGYPHFTHLLALKAAEDAIAEERRYIDVNDLERSTRRAVNDAEGSLRATYDNAVRSYGTDEFKRILLAAAVCRDEEIKASELRAAYENLFSESITQNSINNYLKRLVSDDGSTVLRRLAKGVYRFADPRMPSYIRIMQGYLPN